MKKSSSSSLSSSDEDDAKLAQLRDSIVTFESLQQKPKEIAFSFKLCKNESENNKYNNENRQTSQLKSIRYEYFNNSLASNNPNDIDYDSDDLNNFSVTPEFQKFVAKKLQTKLDE